MASNASGEPIERLCWLVCSAESAAAFFASVEAEPWLGDDADGSVLRTALQQRRPADGLTALMVAITDDREVELVAWLIERGADASAVTEDRIFNVGTFVSLPIVAGRNLLHLAHRCGASAALKSWLDERYPAMSQCRDANGLLPGDLSPNYADDARPSQRRMLRSGDVSLFERFVSTPLSDFFAPPDAMEVLGPGVTAVPMLSAAQCDAFERFLGAHPPSDPTPPNTMNKYGVSLAGSPAAPLLDRLLVDYMPALMRRHCAAAQAPFVGAPLPDFAAPFAPTLDPDYELTSQYAFTIEYQPLADTGADEQESGRDRLAFHYDKSYFTVNLCLVLPDDDDAGSTLYFDYFDDHARYDFANTDRLLAVRHRRGWAVLHSGAMYHGASPIAKQRRKNLVIWCR